MKSLTEVAWLDAADIIDAVGRGELDPQDVVRAYLERIERLDPRLHAYVHVDRGAETGSGPLAGVTLAVKDTQPVSGMPWTYGARAYKNRVADSDGVPVARARTAGAAILGKANTPELAAAISTVNELFPATQNPWREGFSPGGSSGGSAAAVAAGLATVGFGDDLGGSIRIPSSFCGVVGLRPSPGLVPDEVPNTTSFNSRGPIGRSVRDLRLLLGVMTGAQPPPPAEPRGLHIGVVTESPLEPEAACVAAVQQAVAALGAAGHRVEQVGWDPVPVSEGYRVVRRVSIAAFPLASEELGASVRKLSEEGRQISGTEYFLAHQKATAAARRTVNALFQPEKGFDALLTPTLGMPPQPIDQMPGFLHGSWDRITQFVLPVSFSRHPAVSLPAGTAGGLPVGVQLVGAYREEWRLLDLAAQLERAEGFGFRRPPGWE
jgi:amidase